MSFPIHRRQLLCQGLAVFAPLAAPILGRSDQRDDIQKNPSKDMITPEAQRAIDHGLKFLEADQHANGSWGQGTYAGNVAVTSLSALALMAGGNQPGRGKYGKCVDRALEYLLNCEAQSSEPGLLTSIGGPQNGIMYNHGFGTLFLAEAYGMVAKKDQQKRVREALERAVALIKKAQNQTFGGWRYDTRGDSSDISVTICEIMALRSARNAGIKVEKSIVDKCVEYVKKRQNPDGGFAYMTNGGSLFPRSAAGVVALYCAGIYEGKEIDSGLNYLMQFKPNGQVNSYRARGMNEIHYFYGHYYAAQAMWTAGGKYWQEWFPAVRDDLLARQRASNDGSWQDHMVCADYATAMACIILQIPNNYLPIMQK